MTTFCVLDTSVLLAEGRRAVWAFPDSTVVIPLTVIRELETKRQHPELGFTARDVLREIRELSQEGDIKTGVVRGSTKVRVELNHIDHGDMEKIGDKVSSANDTKIVSVAKYLSEDPDNDVTLYTSDIPLSILAGLIDVKTGELPFKGGKSIHDSIQTHTIDDDILDTLYANGSTKLDLDVPINSGVILQSEYGSALAIHKTGYDFRVIRESEILGIKGKSAPQRIAMEQLSDESIKAISLGGRAGTGKTLLALASGIDSVLRKESPIERVVVFRNMYAVGDQELGFLPGTEAEKMDPWTMAIWDAVNSIPGLSQHEVTRLKNTKALEVLPLTHIRGRTFHNTVIVVDEAQNLTRDVIKTVLTRAGTNTRVILTHDISQRDNHHVGRHEGIYEVVSRMQGSKLFGHTTLTKSERSDLAEVASELLDD